jgi:hypothetical protein
LEDNFDPPSRDHLTADAQDYLIHDRYSHVPAVALVAQEMQEMQEWAIEQQERHGETQRNIISVSRQVKIKCNHIRIINPDHFLS